MDRIKDFFSPLAPDSVPKTVANSGNYAQALFVLSKAGHDQKDNTMRFELQVLKSWVSKSHAFSKNFLNLTASSTMG